MRIRKETELTKALLCSDGGGDGKGGDDCGGAAGAGIGMVLEGILSGIVVVLEGIDDAMGGREARGDRIGSVCDWISLAGVAGMESAARVLEGIVSDAAVWGPGEGRGDWGDWILVAGVSLKALGHLIRWSKLMGGQAFWGKPICRTFGIL